VSAHTCPPSRQLPTGRFENNQRVGRTSRRSTARAADRLFFHYYYFLQRTGSEIRFGIARAETVILQREQKKSSIFQYYRYIYVYCEKSAGPGRVGRRPVSSGNQPDPRGTRLITHKDLQIPTVNEMATRHYEKSRSKLRSNPLISVACRRLPFHGFDFKTRFARNSGTMIYYVTPFVCEYERRVHENSVVRAFRLSVGPLLVYKRFATDARKLNINRQFEDCPPSYQH